jgi:hypothetical protein
VPSSRGSAEIKIGHERAFLVLSDVHEGSSTRSSTGKLESMHVELVLPHCRAQARVWLSDFDPTLTDFFDELALNWRGWKNAKQWQAYEGGLSLSCASDGRGHVYVTVELREPSGSGWLVRGDVPLDAGQLEEVARKVRQFMKSS